MSLMQPQSQPSPPSPDPLGAPDPIGVREAQATDLAFIYSTWLRAARAADSGPLPDDLWFSAHRELITRALADSSVSVLIAHPVDAVDQILGYVVAEPKTVLLWIHVRDKFRGMGLGKRLLQAAQVTDAPAAWWTRDAEARLRNRRRTRQLRRLYAQTKPAASLR